MYAKTLIWSLNKRTFVIKFAIWIKIALKTKSKYQLKK